MEKTAIKTKKNLNSHTILLWITVGLFILLYAAGYFMYGFGENAKGFEKLQNFLDIFRTNAALICIACGMTCVMLTGGIDISVGSLVAMDCMILSVGMENSGISPTLLVPFVLLIGIVFGAVQGYLIGYLGIQPFIVTMAGMFFARGMTAMICTDQVNITAQNWFKDLAAVKVYMPFELGAVVNKRGVKMVPYVNIPVVIALVVVILVFLMLRYTRTGRSMYAVGGNQQSAALLHEHHVRYHNPGTGTGNEGHFLRGYRRYAADRRCGQCVRLLRRRADQRYDQQPGKLQRRTDQAGRYSA